MASCLSSLGVSHCYPSQSPGKNTIVNQQRFPPILQRFARPFTSVRAMAMARERKDHLDRLQRPSDPPHKRMAPVAPVGIWDRFPTARTIQQMMDTMERIMEDPFEYSSMNGEAGAGYRRGRTPWEIKEGEAEYKMRFDMPGMTRKDVKVSVEEKMLVVKAEKQAKSPQEEGTEEEEEWSARSYGRYSSRIALPDNIDEAKIKAEVKDGVLYITIPKAQRLSKVLDINVQ